MEEKISELLIITLKIQKILPIVIQFTQQPIEVKCFGSVACDRETFKYVCITDRDQSLPNVKTQFTNKFYVLGGQDSMLLFYSTSTIQQLNQFSLKKKMFLSI